MARQIPDVDETATALQQAGVLDSRDRLADAELSHASDPVRRRGGAGTGSRDG